MGWFDKKDATVKVEIREVEKVREVVREVPVAAEAATIYRVGLSSHFYLHLDLPDCVNTYWATCEEAFAAIALCDDFYKKGVLTVSSHEAIKLGGEYALIRERVQLGRKPDLKNAKKKKVA